MIGLAIHTSSPELGLALIHLEEETTRSRVWPLGRDLTQYLHTCLQDFVQPYQWRDIAYLAVAKGPGGFTGTRIGVVVARTLAQQLSVPLFGISSLAAIAQQHQQTLSDQSTQPSHIAVSMQAQRGDVFGAIYQRQAAVVQVALADAVYSQADWDSKLRTWSTPYDLIQAEDGLAHTVTGVLALAHSQWQGSDRPSWETVLPFYGQHPVHR
ncbi:tRNA (adenosine(37)-N6)-threonylcarbamoyltransferase complex dimerization subunit type 1 TsaB [Oscillatoria sp. CS-180]|uniref:tRNA (adenosine(37)-N6)-threonylcarbamoyltransferase complex dimerization subunit type 1 TsaB n=1 Tax=Oscillatoria sp. CS-180 TaxID=3021720 RepID=UPI00232CCBE4|nr:tRNA (adenosine(37)-N6)-threonylcarbamoyltransferase complex dimerization subunit type 1 TsaB [Oscillatoria sp. CS-180]MDB9527697.1 tRNA (adenosine(37)-N6)-threonylcarbamoyltransferase complex dimerization subunit type 1 TsaB [Oscillatoria sp. CS-180]